MLRTHDDADVGRSVDRYRALASAYGRLADRLRVERDAIAARLAPLSTVGSMGGAQSRAIVAGGPVARMVARSRRRLSYLSGKLSVVNREVRFWLSAVDEILSLHREEAAKGRGWTMPVCHDPSQELNA